ncbi:MAG: tRNA (N6-threonylcarbamoyladenosine(37)-N6)-methyltransferase TrmO [Candidatus Hatepunaea meridiana]|nr:tRNA (N6-threonylcarbamoyladenosine(37)-N6)-methyltransferase TrmO [Candidatus Hatepunaea meridiana]
MPECPLIQIGHIVSPYNEQSGTPIQASFGEPLDAEVHIYPDFREGLTDLDRFSRIWLISWLDKSTSFNLKVIPYRDTVERGLFSTRAPRRPNPVGISSTQLISVDIETGILKIKGIDLLNGTPILDIKPYAPRFDSHSEETAGWLDKGSDAQTADDRFSNKET